MKVKTQNCKIGLIIITVLSWAITVSAEITPDQLHKFILDNKKINGAIKEFYTRLSYQTAWIQKENKNNCAAFFSILKQSADWCLRETDYQFDFIKQFRDEETGLKNLNDSLEAEVRITDAAIHFFSDIAYGNTKPVFGFYGLTYTPACHDIPVLLADYVSTNKLHSLSPRLTPALSEIKLISNKVKEFLKIMADSNFTEVIIKSAKVSVTNRPLISKLYQLGIIDSPYTQLPDNILKQKVKEAQRYFNLVADGTSPSTIMAELNIPMAVRLQQLNLSVNYCRWLSCLIQNRAVIVVNIPGTLLKVYQKDSVFLEMRVIVGKKSTRTPTLASTISEVILYPYWHVPYSIATKELLPAIKRNPGYIDAGNYQVLDNRTGKVIDPYSINWSALSTKYFPYIIRQSTGCDNALGLLKLNFYSPYGVYLHDTSNKYLFTLNKRFFSHGCMRMEKPMELGYLILKNNRVAIDTLEQKGCLRNQSPIVVPAEERMPVIVWYNPVGIDNTGRLLFYEDVYDKFSRVKK